MRLGNHFVPSTILFPGLARILMRSIIQRSSRVLTLVLVALFVVPFVPFREVPQAQGTAVALTVRITRVIEVDCDEEIGEKCPNDYFSKANIDGSRMVPCPRRK